MASTANVVSKWCNGTIVRTIHLNQFGSFQFREVLPFEAILLDSMSVPKMISPAQMYENVSVDEKDSKPSSQLCSSEDRFTRVLISGAGFLADAYDLFVINLSVDLMSRCEYKSELTSVLKSRIKSMALAGAIVGQLGFGSVADLIGRKWVFIMTCTIVILGSVLSATVVDSSGGFGIFSQLSLWRFLLGVGVGGEYPLSAAVTAESSDPGTEIRNLAMVRPISSSK